MYLAMIALDRGYADPRWGGWRQIWEVGGYVRKGERGGRRSCTNRHSDQASKRPDMGLGRTAGFAALVHMEVQSSMS